MARPRKTQLARVSIMWSTRKKCWEMVISGGDGVRTWRWQMDAQTTVELDEGTGWLVLAAIRDALEAQLM